MSYYKDMTSPTVKFLYKRLKELEYKQIVWRDLTHFQSRTRLRAMAAIENELAMVKRFIKEVHTPN